MMNIIIVIYIDGSEKMGKENFLNRDNNYSSKISDSKIKEFKVNKYILLRLEGNNIVLYVNGRRFLNCKRLLINIPIKNINKYDGIESIDEASELYNHYLINNKLYKKENGKLYPSSYSYDIPPETEFWGHCSNIQAWIEHDYDTRIIHSNLAFPLLKELTKAGEPKAKKVFKDEIVSELIKALNFLKMLKNVRYISFVILGFF